MKRARVAVALLAGACLLWAGRGPAVRGQAGSLAAPTGVAASDASYNNKVGISWDVVRGATSYRVYRHTANDPAAATAIGTTAEAVFFDPTALAGQSYFYWVRAENGSGASGLSASDAGTRGTGTAPPLAPPVAPPGNPVTAAKAALGKALFWDEQLSSSRTVACGTCHIALNGGSDPRSLNSRRAAHPGKDGTFGTADDIQGSPGVPLALADGSYQWSTSFGVGEQVTGRRGMSHVNSGYGPVLFWDGRASQTFRDPLTNEIMLAAGGALESQALGPILNDVEMAHTGRSWGEVTTRIAVSKPLALSPSVPPALAAWIGERSYPELFAEVFGTAEITPARIAMAIATYERTLYSDRTPFDVGDLTAAETRGRQVFNQSECNDCHAGTMFTNFQFENTGVRPSDEDSGRFAVTSDQNDLGRFSTPSLRNIELRAPYMHNGRFNTLEDVVEFYNRGGDFPGLNTNRRRIRRLNLTAQQKADLVAFLKRPLTDPRVAADLPPFDRPALFSESMRVPQVLGSGLAGAGGLTPQPVAIEPPLAGNPRFTVAVRDALGGAQATLVIDRDDPGATTNIPATGAFARVTVRLAGAGAGAGYGSVSLSIPNQQALIGTSFMGRWYVADAAASGGVAVTPAFRFTIFGGGVGATPVFASASAASYAQGAAAPESILAGFGANLAPAMAAATALPLPETLGGATVTIRDARGVERAAPLFFVSSGQINYQVPAGVAFGEGTVTIRQAGAIVAAGWLQIAAVAPGFFTADASGRGAPAAALLRVRGDGSQSFEPIAQFDAATNRFEAVPIDFGPVTDQVFLVVFGTGIRQRTALANVLATIGETPTPVLFAGAQGGLVGVDQVNLQLPRSLAGRGSLSVQMRVDGKSANPVTLTFR